LGIPAITYSVIVHPQHDPGCLNQSAGLLAVYRRTHRHALVIFDREGCGRDSATRTELELAVEAELTTVGWEQRSAVIVIDPELENWVWSLSPHVASCLGWNSTGQSMQDWLVEQGHLTHAAQAKPGRPKEAVEAVLKHAHKPRSSAIYRELATRVSLANCTDPAFLKFRQTLHGWFSQ
jgi:hypothetical protein